MTPVSARTGDLKIKFWLIYLFQLPLTEYGWTVFNLSILIYTIWKSLNDLG